MIFDKVFNLMIISLFIGIVSMFTFKIINNAKDNFIPTDKIYNSLKGGTHE